MNTQPYWFVTTFEKIESDKSGSVDTGDIRCWGFFRDRQVAVDALHTNATDMYEFCYDYAVLEKYYEGLLGYGHERQFFRYEREKDGYFEIDEPEHLKDYFTFAQIG